MSATPAPPAPSSPGRSTAGRGPVTSRERSLAPDLARGTVLLFIALANVSIYVYGRTLEPGHRPVGGTSLDNALDVLVSTVVDRRSYPMFALLFGYGMVQLIRRQAASGAPWPEARRVLVRRNLFLILFGAVHAVLLFEGDILGPYGGIGLIVTLLFLRRSTRVLAVWVGVTVLVLGLVLGSGDAFTAGLTPEGESDYLASVAERLLIWSSTTVIVTLVLGLLAPTLIGVLMARAELLDRPWDHLTTLRRMAGIGIPVGLLGGLPFALTVGGYWNPGGLVNGLLGMLHSITGVAAGAGYVALFGLWAAGRRDLGRTGAVAALAATGERSLTCYLWQSLLLAPVLSAWGLGLGDEMGSAAAYALALSVWASSVLVAVALAQVGHRGPAEMLLRRLTYGRR